MFSFLVFVVFCASCLAAPITNYSYSLPVGTGSGTSFSTARGGGRITAIRVWEVRNAYITGIQVSNGYLWSARVGRAYGSAHDLILFDGETIIQVSGKYHTNYIYQLQIVTSRGRSLIVGQPAYASFNFYPTHPDAELIILSGRTNNVGITSVGAHWGVVMDQNNRTSST